MKKLLTLALDLVVLAVLTGPAVAQQQKVSCANPPPAVHGAGDSPQAGPPRAGFDSRPRERTRGSGGIEGARHLTPETQEPGGLLLGVRALEAGERLCAP